ncbi:LysR family transcriptional regulator [Pseudomonas sp. CBSPBW29]|uniref:LysR family transcriptional regulator n=1 Tax=Pseudomonas sp. CBS TaxID=2971912 RepID=UPI0021AC6795|nr:LysR family transcriptional regulator [Pseudomonas sp. CBS]WEL43547.1 LysR family transcriptional regulator [Pseudomonas sp. CBSPBW29]WEL64619.1 LysR family transcriptional regulator [Pseudomonas sp. CBSPGW29]WEL68084.1 LysR family transcriptional regulator [Pseudomonas sp. CBSPCGW29]WEL75108.1 LysR family transcriptional regulator [Pseudomonas sp. CBSPAW29]WEL80647.1 LysR family transcriptional regulator [Pseudomonas sp. CBSPCAW29]WEL89163.1 LysR family transcriptional regulator [Pseudomo
MDRFTEIELFVQTAELGRLSKAAEKLDISNAAASRHLAALEDRLKVRLIERNTRRLALTNAGHEFYGRCKSLLAELGEAEASVNAALVEPTGTLTITATVSFSLLHLAPLVPEFQRLYPRIKIKILGANRYYDIMDSEIDLAIRTREFEADSNITIRRLAQTRRVLAASPSYLATHGAPKTVTDLHDHDLLIYSHANHPHLMEFSKGEEKVTVKVQPSMESNDGQIVRAAALAGAGILVQPKYIIYDDLVAGRLLPVLDDWDLPRLTINLAFQERRYMPAKTRLFIDFLLEHFKLKEYERYWTR